MSTANDWVLALSLAPVEEAGIGPVAPTVALPPTHQAAGIRGHVGSASIPLLKFCDLRLFLSTLSFYEALLRTLSLYDVPGF